VGPPLGDEDGVHLLDLSLGAGHGPELLEKEKRKKTLKLNEKDFKIIKIKKGKKKYFSRDMFEPAATRTPQHLSGCPLLAGPVQSKNKIFILICAPCGSFPSWKKNTFEIFLLDR